MFFNQRHSAKEQGFTLIELLVVILIIGVLAAIAIPMFLNQRKSAIEASIESDLKNAATVMETEMVRNNNKYPSTLPLYDKQSDDNKVFLDPAWSTTSSYCLTARSVSNPSITRAYSSLDGGLLARGKTCSAATMTGESFQVAMASTKALIVDVGRGEGVQYNVRAENALKSVGITDIETIPRGTLTVDKAKDYDLVFLTGGVWAMLESDRNAALTAFNQYGISVMNDGNDTNSWHSPLIATAESRKNSEYGTKVTITPTFNPGLTPSFPYTFKADSFDSYDSWACPKTPAPGAVVIGDSDDPEKPGEKCLTMLGMTSASGGRWVHVILLPADYSEPATNFASISLNWLMQK